MFPMWCEEGQSSCHQGHHQHGHFGQGLFESLGGGSGPGRSRGFLRPVILLLLAEKPCHGYELVARLKEFGVERSAMDPSILYRILRQMERSGLAESSLDDTGAGPARKVYGLTADGREVLDMWAASIEDVSSFLSEFKKRYESLS